MIGESRLHRALKTDKVRNLGLEVECDWSPWLLHPQMQQTIPKREAYTRMFKGRTDKVEKMEQRMKDIFKAEGLSYTLEGDMGPTIDSHRVIELAREQGGAELQGRVVHSFFDAYFAQGLDISDHAVISSIAEGCGVAGVPELLSSSSHMSEVQSSMREARSLGVTGVPHFFFSYQAPGLDKAVTFSMPGAQDVNVFEMVFAKLVAKADQARAAKL